MMGRQYGSLCILILIGLLVPGCTRIRSPGAGDPAREPVSAAGQTEIEEVKSERIPASPPEEPRRSPFTERRSREQPVSAAFFARGDTGFSTRRPDVFDYEIGRLRRRIPDGLDVCLSLLGESLPAEYLAPEWHGHLNRQSGQFGRRPESYRVSAEGDREDEMNSLFKALWNNRMVIGFLRARSGADGRYLLEDLGISSRVEKPYPKIEIPPPVADSIY